MKFILLMLLAQATAAPSSTIDTARIDAEIAADAAVLDSLKLNGDVPTIKRPVDVRFVGRSANIAKLKGEIGSVGWRVVREIPTDAGDVALDVQTEQTTDPAAIRRLTETALRVEAQYGVRYDGWGTVATKQ
jgi:hypothetical protein